MYWLRSGILGKVGPGSAPVHAFEQADQRLELRRAQFGKALVVEAVEGRVEAGDELAPRARDAADDLAAILRGPLALDELLVLETVDQAGDAWRALDHPRCDLEGRQPAVAGAAQDAQHVVL